MRRAGQPRHGIVGLDIQGWRDWAVRDWQLGADGMADDIKDGVAVDGGPLSCVVSVGPDDNRTWIAGPGARLAPHGRGDGWGGRGAAHLRRSLRHEPAWDGDLAQTIAALAARPAIAVLGIPDLRSTSDEMREARLKALRSAGVRRGVLAWSSILICLGQIARGKLATGARVGTVEQEADGLRLQVLDIRDRDGVLVPRRKQNGWLVPGAFGFSDRAAAARENILRSTSESRLTKVIERIDLPDLLAMEAPGTPLRELVRLGNGDWREIEAPAPDIRIEGADLSPLDETDVILVHGPGSAKLTEDLAARLGSILPVPAIAMSPDAVAHGAFIAGQRIREGLPLWFDFLPQIETIVIQDGEARSIPLIPRDADIEAGRSWRSREPLELTWPSGEDELRVWLRKEDADRPRLAPARATAAPSTGISVQLHVEQSPAQDRARLTLTSSNWEPLRDQPAIVDWSSGQEDPRSWDQIIEAEQGPRPTIPSRVVLPADARMWGPDGADLLGALEAFDGEDFTPVYLALQNRRKLDAVSADPELRERKYYAVDSDGQRPVGVSDNDWSSLMAVVDTAERAILDGRTRNNHAFGVVSWMFQGCPLTITNVAVDVLNQMFHPQQFQGWQRIYRQGLGRIVSTRAGFDAAISYLDSRPELWNTDEMACASFMLSRNDTVFERLDEPTFDRWLKIAEHLLIAQLHDFRAPKKFIYLPTVIAGLLRWRLVDGWALVLGRDPRATGLVSALDDVIAKIQRSKEQREADLPKHLGSYLDIRPFFEINGGNPNILRKLFDRT